MYIIHHPLWQQHYVCIQLTHKQLPGWHISKSDKHTNAKTHKHRDIKDIITHNSCSSHHEDQGYWLSNYLVHVLLAEPWIPALTQTREQVFSIQKGNIVISSKEINLINSRKATSIESLLKELERMQKETMATFKSKINIKQRSSRARKTHYITSNSKNTCY